MISLLIAVAVSFGALPVQVRNLAGESHEGQLAAIEGNSLVLETNDGRKTFPFNELLSVSVSGERESPSLAVATWITLVDGSTLQANRLTVNGGLAYLELIDGRKVSISTRSIESVRQRSHVEEPEFAKQWKAILSEKAFGDVLVIRRTDALDQLSGKIGNVDAETLQFNFDGDTIDVKREKLEGWSYYHPAARNLPNRLCQLIDTGGCRWNVKALAVAGDVLETTTVAGEKLQVPLANIRELDFSSGNVSFLSDLEPESWDWRPYLRSRLPNELLEKLFRPRRDKGPDGGPLLLGGRRYAKGLSIPSRTELSYRLTDDYRQFHAVVGIDDSVRDGGNVDLIISGNDKELFSKRITGRDEPITVDLDITGVRRLKILVDFGDELDIADHLNLCDARITK